MFASTKERDAAEVRRVLQGDPERFGVLVERYLPGVMALTAAHLRNMADAEDAAQEAFLRAYRSLPNLREPRDFGAWLFTIARNASRGMIRGRIREDRAVDAIAAAAIPQPSPADAELRASVRERIDVLDPDYREALLLHYYAGLTSAEMGRSLGISAAAARKRLQRAREALGEAMSRELAASLPADSQLKERGAKIMGAVGALGIVWEAQAAVPAAAALTVASLLPSSKLAIGAIVGIAATLGFGWFVAQQAEDSPTDAVEIQLAAQQPAETPQSAAQPPEEPAPEPAPTPDVEPTPEPAPEPAPEPEAEPWPDTGVTNAQIEDVLKQSVGLVFEDIHIVDLIDFIQDTYPIRVNGQLDVAVYVETARRLPFYIDAESVYIPTMEDYEAIKAHREARQRNPAAGYVTDGMFESIDIRDKPVGEMLAGMTEALGLDYVSEPGYFWISTPQRIAREVVRLPDARYARYDNEAVAGQTESLVFNDIHLREILDFVSDTYDVGIIVDTRVVAPPPREEVPILGYTPEGYVTSGLIPFVNLQDVELRDVFRGLFRTLNLDYRVEHGAILIASPARLNSGNLTRTTMLTPGEMHEQLSKFTKAHLDWSTSQPAAPEDEATQQGPLIVRHIRTGDDGKPTAQIQTPLGGLRWYEEGHAFEQFRVDKIDVERNQVHLTDETTGEEYVVVAAGR